MKTSTIAQLRQHLKHGVWSGDLHLQVETLQNKETNTGKPYREIKFRDASDALTLRAWSDSPAFEQTGDIAPGAAVALSGEFYDNGQFGPDARRWHLRPLTEEETDALFAGSPAAQAATAAERCALEEILSTVRDPRLRALAERFLAQHGSKFYRAAAARSFHHARRGGLLNHTLTMLRAGDAICQVYGELNRDLLLTGILFHDAGKLWETCPPEKGFDIPYQLTGEMLGHISIGIELVNRLWTDLAEERTAWRGLTPESEQVRLHLLHLIASHHGELAFGSPVEPKIPEAFALHHLDNLDAKLEMARTNYAQGTQVAEGIYERARPLPQRLVQPLPPCPAMPPCSALPASSESLQVTQEPT